MSAESIERGEFWCGAVQVFARAYPQNLICFLTGDKKHCTGLTALSLSDAQWGATFVCKNETTRFWAGPRACNF